MARDDRLAFFRRCSDLDLPIILIDGDVGAGKTALAVEIAAVTSRKMVSLDDYLLGNCLSYPEQIDYFPLKREIAKHFYIVLEGAFSREVISRLGIEPNVVILALSCIEHSASRFLTPIELPPPKAALKRDLVIHFRKWNFPRSAEYLYQDFLLHLQLG